MRRGLASQEFIPYFQPIYRQSPTRLIGFEALVRWNHPSGVLPSGAFVRQAEETGLIAKIDKNVISRAIKTAKKWSEAYPETPFVVSVNASRASFKDPSFVPFILNRLEKNELSAKYFVLEVTEGIFIESFEEAIEKLNLLKDRGVKIALDDFGTGYSSLQYVSQLPLNYIKIDKSFIDQLFSSEKAMRMVRSIIDMVGMLGLGVVAEGVESVPQLDWLAEYKDTRVQGYFFSPPLPPEEAECILADANALLDVTQKNN
jgi:EAL domain-containing protein (putative c-di-GMP-specific phosphodiesterase class I)